MALGVASNGREDLAHVVVLAERHEEGDCVDGGSRDLLLSIEDTLDQLELVLRDVDLVLRAKLGQRLEAALLLALKESLELLFVINGIGLDVRTLHHIASGLELLRLLVALLDLLVVLKVVEEFAPRNELLVVDGVILLRQLHHLVHLIALDLIEDLVEGEHLSLLAGDTNCLGINEVDDLHVHPEVLNVLSALKNAVAVLVQLLELLLHCLDLRGQQQAL